MKVYKPRREFKPYQRDIYYADEMDHFLFVLKENILKLIEYKFDVDEGHTVYHEVKKMFDVIEE